MVNNDKEDHESTRRDVGSMAIYREAVNEFSSHARDFLECIPVLGRARDAYQRAMAVSSELRTILDTGDEALRSLMSQMEQAISIQLDETKSENRTTELANVEPIRPAGRASPPAA